MAEVGGGSAEVTTDAVDAPVVVVLSALGVELLAEALLLCGLGSLVAVGVLSRVDAGLLLVVNSAALDVSPDEVEDSLVLAVSPVDVAELGSEPVVPGVEYVDENPVASRGCVAKVAVRDSGEDVDVTTDDVDAPCDVLLWALAGGVLWEALLLCPLDPAAEAGALRRAEAPVLLLLK